MDAYLTLSGAGEAVYTEKRSKFLAFALPVADEEAAKSEIARLRKAYYDARHVCYAYVLGNEGQHTRSNDDGEPSGSAGKPILNQITAAGLTYTLVAVVRYFGGVKLGTGGLAVAYKTAAAEAIASAPTEERLVMAQRTIEMPYTVVDLAMRMLRQREAQIVARDFTATSTLLTFEIRAGQLPPLVDELSKVYEIKLCADDE